MWLPHGPNCLLVGQQLTLEFPSLLMVAGGEPEAHDKVSGTAPCCAAVISLAFEMSTLPAFHQNTDQVSLGIAIDDDD